MTAVQQVVIPEDVSWIIDQLNKAGFEGYAVGGGVRDVLLGREPKDWDVATNATPPQIQKVFPKTMYENRFGTVGVHHGGHVYEVTTYRTEAGYDDARHPEQVEFVASLKEDLARRDFTINAMAIGQDGRRHRRGQGQASTLLTRGQASSTSAGGLSLIDLFGGQDDLGKRLIRAVGNPAERFAEDALRMLRAVRLAVELGFKLNPATQGAIMGHADRLKLVSGERVRDELLRLLASPDPYRGVRLLLETGQLAVIIPELLEGKDFDQAKHHKDSVLDHSLLTLKHTPSPDPLVRLAALLHDVGKPRSARGEGEARTFHGHEVIGARMTKSILRRLRFSKADTERVVNLVRHHMFLFQFESTDKAVRRIIRRAGRENLADLVVLRVGDRLGSGCKVGYTTKLKKFEERVVDVQKDPIDTRMLKIDGHDLMREFKLQPGPVLGTILNQLLEDVLDDPKRNTKEYLLKRSKELLKK